MEPTPQCPPDDVLTQLVEGTLDATAAAGVAAHTETCTSCRKALAALAKLRSGSGSGLESTASPLGVTAAAGHIPPGTSVGRYVVKEPVGVGAMGVVYAALDPALDRHVALKLLKASPEPGRGAEAPAPEGSAPASGPTSRLLREGQVMAKLSHPNVITVFDVGLWGDRAWVAMELIEGATLRDWLTSAPRSPEAILDALAQAGRGLAAAHARGLVHRDFKPDNVLVEKTGRVVVTDFGLAAEPESRDRELLVTNIEAQAATRTGALVGTPAYMAPEQLDGQRADARSDQFSFCVTCVEAFTGRRPFVGADLGTLRTAIGAGLTPVALTRLPGPLRRVVQRGLAVNPLHRFDSMDALLATLTPRRRGGMVAVAALAVLAVAGVSGPWAMSRARLCGGAQAQLEGVWDPPRQQALQAAFVASKQPWAEASAKGLTASLDSWAKAWTQAWTDACEDTRVRGTQSEELLDLRMACLAERRQEVSALTTLLATADGQTLEASGQAFSHLSPLDTCADAKALRAPVRVPRDAAVAQQVGALSETLAKAVALRALGRYPEAKTSLAALAEKTGALGFKPLEADLLVQLGQTEEEVGELKSAAETYRRALLASEASGHVLASAQAWTFLVRVHAKLAQYPQAHDAAEHAEVLTQRLDRPPELDAVLARNLADLLSEESRFKEALAQAQRALAIQQKAMPGSTAVAATLDAVGELERRAGDVDGGLAHHQQALTLFTSLVGADHPDVAQIQKNIGNAYWGKGDVAQALTWYRKALVLQTAAFGADSLEVASTRNNVASVMIRAGKLAEAEVELRAVIAIVEKKLGPEHPELFGQLNNLAIVLRYTKRIGEAEKTLRRALAIAQKAHGEAHDDVATTLINLGDVLLEKRDFAGSVAAYERAAAISEKIYGAVHPNVADCWGGAAFPLLQLKKFPQALASSDKALAIYAKAPGIPLAMAQVHFAHAEAWYQVAPKKRREAVAEAKAARKAFKDGGAQPSDLEEFDRWLKQHK